MLHSEAFRDDAYDFDGPADFGAAPDPMYDFNDGINHAQCTCGFRAACIAADANDYHEYPQHEEFAGCRGCDPTDYESKPHGFGIESFEDPALHAANYVVSCMWIGGPYHNCADWPNVRKPIRDRIWHATTQHNKRLEHASDNLWYRLCCECQTHREAKAKYEAWAKNAVHKVYGIKE